MKRMLLGILVLVLAGCAIAPARYLNQSLATHAPGTSAVSIERHTMVGADSAPLTIFVDGTPSAEIHGGQVVTMYLTDGRHSIGVGMAVRTGTSPEREIAIDVSPSSQPILRAHTVALGYGGWGIDPVNR